MNKMTKKNSGWYDNYLRADAVTLRDVYKNPSDKKVRAEYCILREMDRLRGFDPRIIYGGCHFFSMAFTYPDPETGALRLRYYTGMNVYDFELTERS